jgi:peroxiredoxin
VDALKAVGVDEVIAFAVNDGAVMEAWAKDQGIDAAKGLISFMGDTTGKLTEALGMVLPASRLGDPEQFGRPVCKRFALYMEDGVIKLHLVAEDANGEDDPAGDNFPEAVMPDNVIAKIKALSIKDEV